MLSSNSSQSDPRRQHQTLSDVIDTFLTNTVDVHGERLSGREIFNNALRIMNAEEGSQVVQDFLDALERMGSDFHPPEAGVSQDFLDLLERVEIKTLPQSADCPICTNRFADNEYPLVVKLPCHVQGASKKEHMFDMDCIGPWLKMNSTCPLCRFNVHDADRIRRQRLEDELRLAQDEEEEEDDWELYG